MEHLENFNDKTFLKLTSLISESAEVASVHVCGEQGCV